MKLIYSAFIIIAFSILACTPAEDETSVTDIKENETIRNSVYEQILNDQELLNEFMLRMMNDPQAMDMMMDNPDMMKHMMGSARRDSMRLYRWQGMLDSTRHMFGDSANIDNMDMMR